MNPLIIKILNIGVGIMLIGIVGWTIYDFFKNKGKKKVKQKSIVKDDGSIMSYLEVGNAS